MKAAGFELDLNHFFRYVYSGFIILTVFAVIFPEKSVPILLLLITHKNISGSILIVFSIIAIGVVFYSIYKTLYNESIIDKDHVWHNGIMKFRHSEFECLFQFLKQLPVKKNHELIAFRLIRNKVFDPTTQEIFHLRHSEIHVLYQTSAACLLGTIICFIKIVWFNAPLSLVAISMGLAFIIFLLVGVMADKRLCSDERFYCRSRKIDIKKLLEESELLDISREQEIRNLAHENYLERTLRGITGLAEDDWLKAECEFETRKSDVAHSMKKTLTNATNKMPFIFEKETLNILILAGAILTLIGTGVGFSGEFQWLKWLQPKGVVDIDNGLNKELNFFPSEEYQEASLSKNEPGFREILRVILQNDKNAPAKAVEITQRKDFQQKFYWADKGWVGTIFIKLTTDAITQDQVYPVGFAPIVFGWINQEKTRLFSVNAFHWIFWGAALSVVACFFRIRLKQ